MVAQSYLIVATGKLTALDTISQMDRAAEQTKYYPLRKYYVDKEFAGIFSYGFSSGKYTNTWTCTFTSPALSGKSHCHHLNPFHWLP
jgi:hypothetical protein